MSQVGKYFKDNKTQNHIESSNGRCEAYGCPLNGSISSAVNSPWYCRFHHNFTPKDYDQITIKIKKYQSLINILDICIKPDITFNYDLNRAEHTIKTFLIQKNIPDLYSEGNLYKTGQNILSFLHDKIKLNPLGVINE